jgi:rhomboid protease GluP
MVGASGAIFGLAGALTVWDAGSRRSAGQWNRAPLILLGLAGVNLAMWWLQSGNLAWETHLGGCIAGMGFALYPRLVAKIRS